MNNERSLTEHEPRNEDWMREKRNKMNMNTHAPGPKEVPEHQQAWYRITSPSTEMPNGLGKRMAQELYPTHIGKDPGESERRVDWRAIPLGP
eukprot:scaffold2710_cov168-Skeletonema_marinoi.AAC.6